MYITLEELETLEGAAERACRLLKALSNRDRLLILCYLAHRERNVSDLEGLLQLRQPTLSQQLARLRSEELVTTRRQGKAIYYSLASDEVRQMLRLMYDLYHVPAQEAAEAAPAPLAATGS